MSDYARKRSNIAQTGDRDTAQVPLVGKRTQVQLMQTVELSLPVQRTASAEVRPAASRVAPAGDRPTITSLFGGHLHRKTHGDAGSADVPEKVAERHTAMSVARSDDTSEVHAAAARGVATPASALPYRDEIQRLFGHHDISSIKAHVGVEATVASRDMSAQAYATGSDVVFGAEPDLHTAAHEAAHVVQQRAGVQLRNGVSESGDQYERHAEAVADKVMHGESAEALLDQHAARTTTDLHEKDGSRVSSTHHQSTCSDVVNMAPRSTVTLSQPTDPKTSEISASSTHLPIQRYLKIGNIVYKGVSNDGTGASDDTESDMRASVRRRNPPKRLGSDRDKRAKRRGARRRERAKVSRNDAIEGARNPQSNARPEEKEKEKEGEGDETKQVETQTDGYRTGMGTPYYELMTLVNAELENSDFDRSPSAARQIRSWVNNSTLVKKFSSIPELVDHLFVSGLLTRKLSGARVGPRTLGPRPGWTGDAARLRPDEGQHRRHVISSSTLGRIIEDSEANYSDIQEFLKRHEATTPFASLISSSTPLELPRSMVGDKEAAMEVKEPKRPTALEIRNAKREAWSLVHNHCGNLWLGPGEPNVASGLIRTPLKKIVDKLSEYERDQEVSLEEIQFPEPQLAKAGSGEEEHWNYVLGVLKNILKEESSNTKNDTEEGEKEDHETLSCDRVVDIIENIIANCDLDLPLWNRSYVSKVLPLYNKLISNPRQAFDKGGALDQFMGLRCDESHATDGIDDGEKG